MQHSEKLKSYKKEFDYSYAIGVFPTLEILKSSPHLVKKILISSKSTPEIINQLLTHTTPSNIPIETNDKFLTRFGGDNIHTLAAFEKPTQQLSPNKPHILLVNPSDMGNLGSIIRSMLGFNFQDLAIITPAADVFHPKVVRSSMGAIFKSRIQHLPSIHDYIKKYPTHTRYNFILDENSQKLSLLTPTLPYTLVFGNEGTGLQPQDLQNGTPIFIEQSPEIDSLNLAISTSIAMHHLYTKQKTS
ncbi:TrmH family RNA methyltransferase [Candidatus Saccharibacteria bacterium]|nr:TrmH family RNA methyltransferase [Candidatus Saccharibacteria bacterium]